MNIGGRGCLLFFFFFVTFIHWFLNLNISISSVPREKTRSLEGINMFLKKIIKIVKKHGWKQQTCGVTGFNGSIGTNFFKDGEVLSVSIIKEGHMTYPDEDELKEMFGEL